MLKKIIILLFLFLPNFCFANTNPSVQARVLPQHVEDVLEITNFQLEYISDNHVRLQWESNIQAASVVEYGNNMYKENTIRNNEYANIHVVDLLNLNSGTLYYYSVGIYNDNDSVGLGNDMFKTSGLRKSFIPNYEELVAPTGEGHIGATANYQYNYNYGDEDIYNVKSELFLLEDVASIFIIVSILLVLILVYRRQREKNKEKKKKWKKLDK